MLFDRYSVELTLTRDMLGTNPMDPSVMDSHVIQRQRKILLEKSKTNSEINKYLNQLDLDKEKTDEELSRILDKLEDLIGEKFPEETRRELIISGLSHLKETFQELELRGVTAFFWDKKRQRPCIGDHMIYGFLKAAAESIGRTLPKKAGTILHSVSYTQGIINQHVRCESQFITFDQDVKRHPDGSPEYLQRSLRAETAQGPRISLAKSEVIEAGAKLGFVLKVLKNSPLTEEHLNMLFGYGEMTGLGQWRNAGYGMFAYSMSKIL